MMDGALADQGELRIGADGEWYWEGNHITRSDVLSIFVHHLERHQDGSYWVSYKGQSYPVTVEDVPFWAEAVEEVKANGAPAGLKVRLKGGREVELPEGTIELAADGTPYLSLFGVRDTKLSRSAYWQLSRYLVPPEVKSEADSAGGKAPFPGSDAELQQQAWGGEEQPPDGALRKAPSGGWRVECGGRVWPVVPISFSPPSTPPHGQG
ncbi:MAG: DUF1285 domain-containing protein [Clostridia bacterium]|nr:DUF1285 domain-containing protein [Clostridia bacterium]